MSKNPKSATITQKPSKENGWSYVVTCDDGTVHCLRGLGAPKGGRVGDKGVVSYFTGASFGLYGWTPSEED